MGTKPHRSRTQSKKQPATPNPADSPFFRPFESLAKAKKKKDKPSSTQVQVAVPDKPKAPPPSESVPQPSDADTFAMYMAGVRALSVQKARIPLTSREVEPRPASPTVDLDADARLALQTLVADGARFEVIDDGQRIEGRRLDVDPRELRRLRRGAYTIDGRLDLHGMTAADARRNVESFVRKRSGDGDRVIALIVGRGNHSPRGIGVLRGEIAAWLSQGPIAHRVAAFASAPEDEGGPGVVLALLAR